MKNVIKKNQVIISTIALMLIVAGYMNYTVNTKDALESAAILDSEQYADLGDAQLVSNLNVEEENVVQETSQNISQENEVVETAVEIEEKSKKDNNQYFTQSKLDRDKMYSQMIESYQKILNNEQIPETQKQIAQEEITNINNRKNAIMISENLIKNKGFEDVIIFLNDKSVNIVVGADELKPEQIAQIQNIIEREIKAEIEDIHITNK